MPVKKTNISELPHALPTDSHSNAHPKVSKTTFLGRCFAKAEKSIHSLTSHIGHLFLKRKFKKINATLTQLDQSLDKGIKQLKNTSLDQKNELRKVDKSLAHAFKCLEEHKMTMHKLGIDRDKNKAIYDKLDDTTKKADSLVKQVASLKKQAETLEKHAHEAKSPAALHGKPQADNVQDDPQGGQEIPVSASKEDPVRPKKDEKENDRELLPDDFEVVMQPSQSPPKSILKKSRSATPKKQESFHSPGLAAKDEKPVEAAKTQEMGDIESEDIGQKWEIGIATMLSKSPSQLKLFDQDPQSWLKHHCGGMLISQEQIDSIRTKITEVQAKQAAKLRDIKSANEIWKDFEQ